ncbi:CRISPR-associated endonuclease Cas1 [bacterium]|nr:CRISPR-associated endonuclease Cas1 [bacterium]
MVNEFVYCPRLFYYEYVEGVFVHNLETIEGSQVHGRVDQKEDDLPPANELLETDRPAKRRSVTLSSDKYGVIAKLDLLETDGSVVTPVDYKRGEPCKADDGSLEAWPADRAQLAVQALVLRENGYACDEAIVYYAKTKQRVRFSIDDTLVEETIQAIDSARELASGNVIPPPLDNSPKCPRCSLVGICLPDETRRVTSSPKTYSPAQLTLFELEAERTADLADASQAEEMRRLVPSRDDLRPLYLNQPGLYVGCSGRVLQVKDKKKVIQQVRLGEICQVNLFGSIQMTTQAIQAICQAEIPIAYFSMGGWFYGVTHGLGVKNIYLRREQFRWADIPSFCLRLARALVAGKIKNQRTLLQRNHVEPPKSALVQMKCMQDDAEKASSMETLLGIEGNAARVYFQNFQGMIKIDDADENDETGKAFRFYFQSRNRRPPRDPINALLSLAYSVLAKDLTIICHTVGFDPYLGFYHQPRYGRAALALDLMEPFRALIADSAVLSAINTRMIQPEHFIRAGNAVALTADGRKAFFRAYEQRMDTLVTHPLFGYRVNYRRILEIQCRLLARVLTGEITNYPVFVTR